MLKLSSLMSLILEAKALSQFMTLILDVSSDIFDSTDLSSN